MREMPASMLTKGETSIMTRITAPLTLLATALAGLLAAAPAQAQTRTYTAVSAAAGLNGVPGSGACGSAQFPCRTLQEAFNVTAFGGAIDVLDPGEYGLLTITHSVSIQGHGSASITTTTTGQNAITISAGSNDKIEIKGVVLLGEGYGANGIQFNSGHTLTVQDSIIRGFSGTADGAGIAFDPAAASELYVRNTVVSENANGVIISNANPAVAVGVVLDNVSSTAMGTTTGTVRNAAIIGNATGVNADGAGAIIRLRLSTITGNTTGWSATNSGSVTSYGDNDIDDDTGGDTAPPSSTLK
jgi:hypothetical protein